MNGYNECIKKGLLRNIPPSIENATASIKTAEKWFEEAKKAFENKMFNSAIMSAYLTFFHSARAILFADGYREKSHYCIARYLEEHYAKKNLLETNWIDLLDYYRDVRHDDQYGTTFITTEKEVTDAIEKAGKFLERMDALLKTKLKKEEKNGNHS